MARWYIDEGGLPAPLMAELEKHYDRWKSLTDALESLRSASSDSDVVKIKPVDPNLLEQLDELQQEAYEAYTSIAGGLVLRAD